MVCEPNTRMCGQDCKLAPCCLRMIHIPVAAKPKFVSFLREHKETGCVGCPFLALGVLCSPQVRGKLINCMRTAQHVSGALIYKVLDTLIWKILNMAIHTVLE